MKGKNISIILLVGGVIIVVIAYYSLNERFKGLEDRIAEIKPSNNYFNNNYITKIEQKIEKIEGTNVIVGDKNTTTVNNLEKTT